MSAALLEVEGLSVAYGAVRAVDGIDFKVEEGRIVSLIGSNGAGKTSTLKSISGLVPIRGGGIRFQGQDITRLSPDERVVQGIAQVPEGRRVFPRMTVWENLQLGAYTREDRAEIARDLEAMTALFPILQTRRDQLAGTLSGGEQQMLAIGRALMSRPKLLIMDEPSMGLAPKMVALILEKVLEIRSLGTTILLVEQNAVEAIRLSDLVYVLRLGRVAFEGPGASLGEDLLKALYLGHDV